MKKLKSKFLITTALILLSNGVGVSSANASQAKSPVSASGTISNGYNFCLGLGKATVGLFLPVVNVSCTANTSVQVTKSITSTGYTIAIGDKCLFVANRTDGSDLFAGLCDAGFASDWVALPEGGIGLLNINGSYSNFCMDVEVGVPKIGSPIQIYTCQGLKAGLRIPAQRWTYPKALFNQSPYPYPVPTPLPVATTPAPIKCLTVGMCSANDVLERVKLITSVKNIIDPSLPKTNLIKWNTEEPWYGKEAPRFNCSNDSFQYDDQYATNFVLSSERNDRSWKLAPVLGTMFRVRSGILNFRNGRLYGGHLETVTVQTTYEGLCQRYYADENGFIIIPRYCNYCILYGFHKDKWPKDAVVEVAEISANGRGGFSTVFVKNPRKIGPSRATCWAIVGLGTVKETLKLATERVAGALPPPANVIVQPAISFYFQKLDNDPNAPLSTKITTVFSNSDKANEFGKELKKVKYPGVVNISKNTVSFTSNVIDLASFVAGGHSVYRDYKNICS